MRTSEEYVSSYLESVKHTAEKLLEACRGEIVLMIVALFEAWKNDVPVFIMGNGGSASSATHFAADLSKTIADKPGYRGLKAITPWDNIPLISAIVNDRPKEDLFTAWLDTHYVKGGVGVGISVHGGSGSDKGGKWSQNLLKGLQYIKDRGGITLGFSGFDGGPMKDLVDVCVVVPEDSTPLVESFHVVLQHLIVFRMRDLIQAGR
ncbi:MAG: SIS domain-containing protein [Candidatus Niyogibacteria bacterium]|nr:MAG: SIS domain-containing protein [Candidatus Niyogibacteria bacterium]